MSFVSLLHLPLLASEDGTHPHMGVLNLYAAACLREFPSAQPQLSSIAKLVRVTAVAMADEGVDQGVWLGFIRILVFVELWNGDL